MYFNISKLLRLPRWLSGKESACQHRRQGLIPGLGRSPGEGNGNSLQYPGLGNSMERGAWKPTAHNSVTKRVGHDFATEQ